MWPHGPVRPPERHAPGARPGRTNSRLAATRAGAFGRCNGPRAPAPPDTRAREERAISTDGCHDQVIVSTTQLRGSVSRAGCRGFGCKSLIASHAKRHRADFRLPCRARRPHAIESARSCAGHRPRPLSSFRLGVPRTLESGTGRHWPSADLDHPRRTATLAITLCGPSSWPRSSLGPPASTPSGPLTSVGRPRSTTSGSSMSPTGSCSSRGRCRPTTARAIPMDCVGSASHWRRGSSELRTHSTRSPSPTYLPARAIEWALEELARYAGTQFDPELARLFIDQVRNDAGLRERLLAHRAAHGSLELRTA